MRQSPQLVFRSNLRWQLLRRNLNQADLSLKTGLPYKWIRRLCHRGLERTDRRTSARLQQLADYFGIEVEDFWVSRTPDSKSSLCKLFRYVGSKHKIANDIVSNFPDAIASFYEPFLGSGEVLGALIGSSIAVERFVCSDVCKPLISVWKLVQTQPEKFAAQYENWYRLFEMQPEITYQKARDTLNKTGDPIAFYFLNRTCRLGKMTFNKNGKLTSGLHFGIRPIDAETVFMLASQWHAKLNSVEVAFKARDYANVRVGKLDFAYLDPPYFVTASYRHKFSSRRFFNWLRKQEPRFALSLGYGSCSKNLLRFPSDLKARVIEFDNGLSSIARLQGKCSESVAERLYMSDPTRTSDSTNPIVLLG